MDSTTEPNTMNESLANDEQTDCPAKCSDGIQTNTETEQFQNGIMADDLGSLLEMFEEAAESMLISSFDSTNLSTPTTIPILDTDNKLDIESTCPLFEQQNASSQDQTILPVDSNNEPVVEETFSSVEFTSGPSVENKTDDSSSCESCTDDQSSSDNQLGSPHSSGRGYRGYTTRHRSKGGSRRQHGRGRNKSTDEEQLFDKLPSYYTVFSRPYRTATGLVRNSSISSVDIIRKSGTLDRDRDPSPDRDNLVLDKIPAYQSCYTNSSKYDEDMLNSWNKTGYNVALNDDEPTSLGRGCSNRRFSNRTRSRSRSKSRGMTRSRGRPLLKSASRGHQSNNIKEMSSSSLDQVDNAIGKKDCKTKFEQRRILYVGRIPQGYTSAELKEKFERFGKILECTVHFRESGDNYGFVTFSNSNDAFHAVENGNYVPGCETFDICFGGRRRFCKSDYTDLDGNVQIENDLVPVMLSRNESSFDQLLLEAMKNKR